MSEISKMISLTEALEIVKHELSGVTLPVETLPVRQVLGRTIVEDQIACLDQPPFDKSAMDGFAVISGDECEEYNVIETVPAGGVPAKKLAAGTAIKVMTGAALPQGTGRVIMIENVRETNGKIRVQSRSEDTNICRKGEDFRSEDIILRAPSVLGPLEIANLISVGITEVKVSMPVRIAILATGNEIVDSPDELQPGKIMNSNGPMLEALCRKYSFHVVTNTIVTDDRAATVSAICEALNNADIVLLSGGVSVGDFDFVADAMKEAGLELHFNQLAIKPGKPMTFASSDRGIAFGLPGNPVAVFLMFHLFVLYAARLMVGIKSGVRYVSLPLTGDFHRRNAERMGFLPCKLTSGGLLEQVEYHGTAHMQALMVCDGFFVVPKDVTEIKSGEKVNFLSIKESFA